MSFTRITIEVETSDQADEILEVLENAEMEGDLDFAFRTQRDEIHEAFEGRAEL